MALLLAGYYYWRTRPELERGQRWLLFLLRFVSLSVLLLLLLSPILYYIRSLKEKQQILVLTDTSASMDLSGPASGAKKNWLKGPGKELADKFAAAGYELHHYDFATGLELDKDNTLLAPALAELAKKHDFSRVKGVVLLSDGWLRDASLQQVKQLGCPFYAITDTTTAKKADLSVVRAITNRQAYRNEPTLIRAEVNSANYNGPATVKLWQGNSLLGSQSVQLKSGVTANVDFTHRFPKTGFFPFRVEVSAPGLGERSQNNNNWPGAIEVLNDKQRVVVLSDSPAWDNKFTLDAISANPRWEASHYRIRDGQAYSGETAAGSLPVENLAALVLINQGGLQLTGNLLSYVTSAHKRGVGILWQGLPLPELASVLPLQRSNITASYQGFLTLTPASAKYPMLSFDAAELKNVPPLDYYYVTASRGAEVLGSIDNAQNSPAIAVGTTGNGKTLALAFLNLWKWQLQSAGGGYQKLLTNSITWLANTSPSGYEAIYNGSYFLGEEINLRLRAQDDIRALRLDLNPQLTITDASGKEVFRDYLTQSEGEYSARFSLDKAGAYSFQIADKVSGEKSSGRFNIADSSIESRDFDFNLPLLSWLSSDTGGKLFSPGSLKEFQPLPAQTKTIEQRADIPLYRKWWVLAIFILSFCLELFFRRRWGLL
ncbi:MAG TPA: hypothetical protein PLK21_06770 [Candidatus Syntrophosphaera sp.]|nr:hypothetical protein [Candidatus Syntrophosphaera sp.]HOH49061.1 hypothetical protein [Candidatus Syntrophosphaera sp.]HPW37952.1 hypothetical protein [Candidatus Syntrophosphaera sp.]HPX67616.1 hypothetical protein [Candidatus Syntrophosphaera sp.]HQC47811.1 hypothetical protein [Candidatus Syntrophosphaera sp.]